ncbi:MAG: hypothetical protein HQL97_03675 [Magnetococcales bacterium]|nr:hypothetical protein [Magnetococcales bacterium]
MNWLRSCLPDTAVPLREAFGRCDPGDVVVFRQEWVGYLPDGLCCWVEKNGTDVSEHFPAWHLSDLEQLTTEKVIEKIGQWRNPDDPLEYTLIFKVCGA